LPEKTVRVCELRNEAEAQLVCSILEEQSIPYALKRMADAAYDGIYQTQVGWGYIESLKPYADSVLQVVEDLRRGNRRK
jgi:hypothetical protein